ncbi:MAG TPA: Ig-like domain-containing protein, partial [Streptosporangiaceae bacterium]|nr:Ig-like domain-containing protein [Streptosporangiaceae bacterium]
MAFGLSAAALGAAGCTAVAAKATPAPILVITPANGSSGVVPGAAINVAAKHGKVQDVAVTTASGDVPGHLANGIWQSTRPLATNTSYTVTATAIGTNHKKVTASSTFQTLTPQRLF